MSHYNGFGFYGLESITEIDSNLLCALMGIVTNSPCLIIKYRYVFKTNVVFFPMFIQNESTTKFKNPCMILEAAEYIAKMFEDNKSVEAAAYGLCAMYNLVNPNG